jgi:hypothetical protein
VVIRLKFMMGVACSMHWINKNYVTQNISLNNWIYHLRIKISGLKKVKLFSEKIDLAGIDWINTSQTGITDRSLQTR